MAGQIPIYNNPIDKLDIPDRGVTAYEQLARSDTRFGQEVGAAIKQTGESIKSGIDAVGQAGVAIWKSAEDATAHSEISKGIPTATTATLAGVDALNEIHR